MSTGQHACTPCAAVAPCMHPPDTLLPSSLRRSPPSAALINSCQAVLSALFLAVSGIAAAHIDGPADAVLSSPRVSHQGSQAAKVSTGGTPLTPLSPIIKPRREPSNEVEAYCASLLNWRSRDVAVAGFELGAWMVLAFGFEVAGLEVSTPCARDRIRIHRESEREGGSRQTELCV